MFRLYILGGGDSSLEQDTNVCGAATDRMQSLIILTGERNGKGGKPCFTDFDTAEPHLIFYKYSEKTDSSPIPRHRFCIKTFHQKHKRTSSECA